MSMNAREETVRLKSICSGRIASRWGIRVIEGSVDDPASRPKRDKSLGPVGSSMGILQSNISIPGSDRDCRALI